MNKQKRTPRPKGLTELGKLYHKEAITLEELQLHIIQHYIATGYRYCGRSYSIEQLAQHINVPTETITQQVIQYGQTTMQLVDPEQSGDLLRATLGLLLSESLADRTRALEQYYVLANAQGQKYKPFISAEVTKALKLTQEATSGILNLYRTMAGKDGINVIVNNTTNTQVNNNYLTTERALELLDKQPTAIPLLEDPKAKEQLFLKHHLENTPEVQANKQQGIDISREGVEFHKLAKVSDALLSDDPKDRHTDRRANQYDVDLDSDEI